LRSEILRFLLATPFFDLALREDRLEVSFSFLRLAAGRLTQTLGPFFIIPGAHLKMITFLPLRTTIFFLADASSN
jgi:hypothetical protein